MKIFIIDQLKRQLIPLPLKTFPTFRISKIPTTLISKTKVFLVREGYGKLILKTREMPFWKLHFIMSDCFLLEWFSDTKKNTLYCVRK